MNFRFDVPLIASAYHFGNRGLGVLGSEIPSTGTNGPGYIYNDLVLPADANKEVRGLIVTPPSSGTFFAYEDSSFTYEGPSTTFTYRLYEDGVDKGLATSTITMSVDVSGTLSWTEADDTTAITSNVAGANVTATLSWTEADDTTAISGNVAAAIVTATVTWTEASDSSAIVAEVVVADSTAPTMVGDITITAITTGGYTASWQAATDDTDVAGYEFSNDDGVADWSIIGNILTKTTTGLASDTLFNVRVRAFDNAGNRAAPITTTVTTTAAGVYAMSLTAVFEDRTGVLRANLTGMKWAFFDQPTPDALLAPTAKGALATTDASGVLVLNITGSQLAPGATGWLVFSNSDGTSTQSNLISFAGPCVVA